MGRRRAFVVTPEREVTDVLVGLLSDQDIGAYKVEHRLTSNPSSTDLGRALVEFCGSLAFDDDALVFLGGRCVIDEFGDSYLVTSDSDIEYLESTALSTKIVDKAIRESPSRRLVVLIDQTLQQLRTSSLPSGLSPPPPSPGGSIKLQPAGLDEVFTESRGKFLLAATEPDGGRVFPHPAERRPKSGLTSLFIEALTGDRADQNGDGLISVTELFSTLDADLISLGLRPPVQTVSQTGSDPIVARTAQGPSVDQPGFNTAKLPQRLTARIVDLVTCVFLSLPAQILFVPSPLEGSASQLILESMLGDRPTASMADYQAMTYTVLFLHIVIYEIATLTIWRTSLGKKLFGLHVVVLPTKTWKRVGRVALRTLPLAVGAVLVALESRNPIPAVQLMVDRQFPQQVGPPLVVSPTLLVLVGFLNLPLALTAQGRTLWDRLASTRVVG